MSQQSTILVVVVAVVTTAALMSTTGTVSAFVHPTTTPTATTLTQRLHAIDPSKEVGVLAPVGFFEYVCVCAYLWKNHCLSLWFWSMPSDAFCRHCENTHSPLNLIERGPYGDRLDNFRHYRAIEVKHGRT
jgi:hypothetical protein